MMPVDFEGSNIVLVKPQGMTDEECFSLPAMKGIDASGYPYFLTAWRPSKEDMEALNAGRPLFVKVMSAVFAPIALVTCDANNNPNV